MICYRILLITIFVICVFTQYATFADSGASREFQDYMQKLTIQALEEGEIPLSKFGHSKFANGVCTSQNLAEKGQYADAAAVLESLVTDDIASESGQKLNALKSKTIKLSI